MTHNFFRLCLLSVLFCSGLACLGGKPFPVIPTGPEEPGSGGVDPKPVTDSVDPGPFTTGPAPFTGPCDQIPCDFETGMCGYQSQGGWAQFTGKLGNPVTGIRRAAQGDSYVASYMNPGSPVSILEIPVDFDKDYVVQFFGYEATDNLELRMCCDDAYNCPTMTSSEIAGDTRSWVGLQAQCDVITKKILFVCENFGVNYGACGVDDVFLVDPAGGLDACAL